jgi:hypothetical protein
MTRVFPRTESSARATASALSAAQVHDKAVGGNERYHLFRLPPEIERRVQTELATVTAEFVDDSIEAALAGLEEFIDQAALEEVAGPLLVGVTRSLIAPATAPRVAALYAAAFKGGYRVYPYFEDPG